MPQGSGGNPSGGNLIYQHDAEDETMENKVLFSFCFFFLFASSSDKNVCDFTCW